MKYGKKENSENQAKNVYSVDFEKWLKTFNDAKLGYINKTKEGVNWP